MNFHYREQDILNALRKIGIQKGDIVFSHISLGLLGRAEGCQDIEEHSKLWLSCIREVIGEEGTFLVPTYSYSLCKNEIFNAKWTKSTIGDFTEYFRKYDGAYRSEDPIFSVAGIGPKAEILLSDLPRNCFGPGCLYERLRYANAKLLMIGVALDWATFLHHTEQTFQVPFRYKKVFRGNVQHGECVEREAWIYNVRMLSSEGYPNATPLYKWTRETGKTIVAPVGRGEIMTIPCETYFQEGMKWLAQDSWGTAKGPVRDPIHAESERLARKKPLVFSPRSIGEWIDSLPKIPRDVISDGIELAISKLSEFLPLKIHAFRSGSEAFGWIVPEKWICHEAILETKSGTRLFAELLPHELCASYSRSTDGVVSKIELLQHLLPRRQTSRPVGFLNYDASWGLRLLDDEVERLSSGDYHIRLENSFGMGELLVGEYRIQGDSPNEILIPVHLCPQEGGAEIEACRLVFQWIDRLQRSKTRKHTITFLFTSENIGTAFYLGHNKEKLSQFISTQISKSGFNVYEISSREGRSTFLENENEIAPYLWTDAFRDLQRPQDWASKRLLFNLPVVPFHQLIRASGVSKLFAEGGSFLHVKNCC